MSCIALLAIKKISKKKQITVIHILSETKFIKQKKQKELIFLLFLKNSNKNYSIISLVK